MEDLIKRSDVWNITAILHSEFITIEQEQILERIDEMVDGLPSADRWIPCSERLPEYGVPVLTWDGSMWATEQRIPFILDDDFNPVYSEWWVDATFDEDYEDTEYYPCLRDGAAVAWMPLPKPWKGADDGEDIQSADE